uniref:Tyrosine specific protein phosphatases domain-containing protein n=1 Tax=Streptomyces avermitilis TaxID=33903 RepID=A0A499VQH4_STRAX|nr:hypothetical protein SAVMC3_12460 [Streptomyces avermitilis]
MGRLFRSDSLGKLTGEEWERFLALGIGTVIDLRYPWEIDAKGRVPSTRRSPITTSASSTVPTIKRASGRMWRPGRSSPRSTWKWPTTASRNCVRSSK